MAVRNFPRFQSAAILDLVEPEVAPFDPLTSKTLPRTIKGCAEGQHGKKGNQPVVDRHQNIRKYVE